MKRVSLRLLLLLLLLVTVRIQAVPIITLPNVFALAGSTNQTFDVVISNPSAAPGAGPLITDYTYGFGFTPRQGFTGSITLTGDWATTPPNSLLTTNPGQGFTAGTYFVTDFVNANPVPMDDGKGLFRVTYSLSSNASGVLDIIPFVSGSHTGVDSRFHYSVPGTDTYVPFDINNGSITVGTPEPAALALAGGGAAIMALTRRRR